MGQPVPKVTNTPPATTDFGMIVRPLGGVGPSGSTPVAPGPGLSALATLTNVNVTAASQTLLAANTDRTGFILVNDSAGGAGTIVYIKYGSSASPTSFTYKLDPDESLLINDGYTGIVTGIGNAALGVFRVTELEPS